MRGLPLGFAVLLAALTLSCQQGAMTDAEPVLFAEDFDTYPDGPDLPGRWWQEGSRAVSIENGRLRADANLDGNGEDHETSTIWLDRQFRGDIKVEFDAHVLVSEGDKNNINIFFLGKVNT